MVTRKVFDRSDARDGFEPVSVSGIPPKGERGFILVPVLLITLLISVAATAFIATTRASLLAQRNSAFLVSAGAIADGAARLVIGKLQIHDLKSNGSFEFCRWGDSAVVALAVQDQAGLVDLNTASPALLAAVAESLKAADPQASSIVGDINDFRDADGQSSDASAEPDTYPNRPYGPKNTPFASIYELDQVPGIDGELFSDLVKLTAVHSQQPGIDLAAAPEPLKQLLTETVGPDLSGFSSPSPRKTFAIAATARLSNGTQFTRHVLLALTQQPDNPFVILEWRRSRTHVADWPEPASLPMCLN